MLDKRKGGQTSKLLEKVLVDPKECPFREFRDNELSADYWGMGPAMLRASMLTPKASGKGVLPVSHTANQVWVDEQTQPLPNSVRQFLHGWVRAEELAESRWEAEVVVFEENTTGGKMAIVDFQLSHTQVLQRSSFCRRVMCHCFILEKFGNLLIEHQWEGFNFVFGPEGWRAKYHIYSPGMKYGGGIQHKPMLSKNGCYLVRIYYMGAWRCVWVSDQVPVDATGAPLLPFSPLSSPSPVKGKGIPAMVTSNYVHLWPLLICKALLKVAAPDMNAQGRDEEESDYVIEDELMPEFSIFHALTGYLCMKYDYDKNDAELLWELLAKEVPVFSWDDDDDMQSSTNRTKTTKKTNPKDRDILPKKSAIVSILMEDTEDQPPYILPGITPCHEMNLIVKMVRDVPMKKPLPEPDVPLWKTYRWVDWARRHGLYEAYDCPRAKFLKVNGLLKLSHATHLLDVQSTESITVGFRMEQTEKVPVVAKVDVEAPPPSKKGTPVKDGNVSKQISNTAVNKEEMREWVLFNAFKIFVKQVTVAHAPTVFEYTSAASNPPQRVTKVPMKGIDVVPPKSAPLYFVIDGPEENFLQISLSMLHPRVLANSGSPVLEYVDKAYLILEIFEWFIDRELPQAKGYLPSRGYQSVEISFDPGRHYCRLWVHSLLSWQVTLMSESTILLGTRDTIQAAAVHECPWVSKYLNNLGYAFSNWVKISRSSTNLISYDWEFYQSYQPDLHWDPKVVGYEKSYVHWMFRQALQSLLFKCLSSPDYNTVCAFLRRCLMDPDFGFPPKPIPPISLRGIVDKDPCDCVMPEAEEPLEEEEGMEEQREEHEEEKAQIVSPDTMSVLLQEPIPPVTSQVCEVATEEVPCGFLKAEREKEIKKHEAATFLQAHWRGVWVRKCLKTRGHLSNEVNRLLNDVAIGSLESLSALMNEFFRMFPGAKYAYSISSALAGVYGLNQHSGVTPITARCKWIPYFQGVFYCHHPVKVHFDINSTIQHSLVHVYDNDTRQQLPQTYNAHITFDFAPNVFGYTVMGHGSLNKPLGRNSEAHWQLTVMTSINNVFHVCDNPYETELCTELPLTHSYKFHIDEIFLPNRRNILGGITISVSKVEAISFRVAASSIDLEMEAILKTANADGPTQEIARCKGKGEIFWPYISLKPHGSSISLKKKSYSANFLGRGQSSHGGLSARSLKSKAKASKVRSNIKVQAGKTVPQEPKLYTIQVIATNGWPLNLEQWKRADEVRNKLEIPKSEPAQNKKVAKEKAGSAKEKKEERREMDRIPAFTVHPPLPDDAFTEIECATPVGGGTYAKRDDDRDILFANARRAWDMKDPGRNLRGAKIREQFREEFLVPVILPKTESAIESPTMEQEFRGEYEGEGRSPIPIRPTPISEASLMELEAEVEEEETLYYNMPEQLRDKFLPLYFVPLCTKERSEEEEALLSDGMIEAAKNSRLARLEGALERMKELQMYNEVHVLGRQKKRNKLLEALGVDANWSNDLATVMEERDEAIQREIADMALTKKKQELKVKQEPKSAGKK